MSYDLLFGKTPKNWSRGSSRLSLSDEVTFRLSPDEMRLLSELAATQVLADSGDRAARKKISAFKKKLEGVQAKAKRGDPQARRTLDVLRESGVFNVKVQSVTLGSLVVQRAIPDDRYRAAVYRGAVRAARTSGRRIPTTRDFYRAKGTVDRVMSESGISVCLPGARRSRITR